MDPIRMDTSHDMHNNYSQKLRLAIGERTCRGKSLYVVVRKSALTCKWVTERIPKLLDGCVSFLECIAHMETRTSGCNGLAAILFLSHESKGQLIAVSRILYDYDMLSAFVWKGSCVTNELPDFSVVESTGSPCNQTITATHGSGLHLL